MKIFEKVGLFVFLAAVVGVQSANAASDFFLKLDGIQGESQDSAHVDEIDVLAWSWNVSREFDSKTGMPAGEPEVRGVKITKYVDTAQFRSSSRSWSIPLRFQRPYLPSEGKVPRP